MDVTVVIGTFGSTRWIDLARERAIPSARALDVPVVHVHDVTLAEARNAGLEQVSTEWVCHLDADDELEAGYFERMSTGVADLRAPAVRYVDAWRRNPPARVPRVAGHRHDCHPDCLAAGNYLVVGSVVRADLARGVGGWREWPVYEDWCLWLRCYRAGATIETIPGAVYRAHVRDDSRNRAPDRELKEATHRAIVESVLS